MIKGYFYYNKLVNKLGYSKAIITKRRLTNNASIERIIPNNGNLALLSLSTNIYYNLALEQYIADNFDFTKRDLLFIWRNQPCIVIGRYQNPWLECNLVEMNNKGVKLARRASGGGCVYHDLGNLNLTFYTNRSKYNRTSNLTLIKSAIDKLYATTDTTINLGTRYDLYINNKYKISGTASRLSKNYSYHHCTLLYSANIDNMKLLKTNLSNDQIKNSKSTLSIRSECKNLHELNDKVSIDDLINQIMHEYWSIKSDNWSIPYLYNYINPEDVNDLSKYYDEYTSWEYIWANTPKFQLVCDIDPIKDKSSITFFIENAHIINIETLNLNNKQLDEFTGYAYLLYNLKIEKNEFINLFNNHFSLLNQPTFRIIYNFFNKYFV